MNNNEWNNQPVNNMNNSNNQNNSYIDNSMNQSKTHKKKVNTKLLAIIVGIIIALVTVIVVALKGFSNFSILGTKENTTGSTEYKGADVDYNCMYEYTDEIKKVKIYSDLIFNYKSTGDDGKQNNYQLKIYNKMLLEFENGVLTDSKYKDIVDSFESMECLGLENEEKCAKNHIELGMTNSGWNTVIDRTGNKIEVTYYNIYGMGATATKEDMKEIKEKYEKIDYICK